MYYDNEQLEFLDILTILSFVIAVQNLELNQQTTNDFKAHLNEQDNFARNNQKEMLQKIVDQNEEIISLLKNLKKG